MFVVAPVSIYCSDDCKTCGLKAEKKECLSLRVWDDHETGSRMKLFFDDKQRVVMAALDG